MRIDMQARTFIAIFGIAIPPLVRAESLTESYQGARKVISEWGPSGVGFSFLPGRTCDGGWIDPSWCVATEPKDWKKEEILLANAWLQNIENDLPYFVAQIQKGGYHDLRRYGHSFTKGLNGKYEREEHGAWVWPRDKSVNFSDFVFLPSLPRYPNVNADPGELSLLHELAHAYELPNASWQEFLNLAGWERDSTSGEWALKKQDMREIKTKTTEMRVLAIAGKFPEAMTLNRDYGVQHGFPTLYSMSNPNECLAELAAWVHFDKTSASYLNPLLISWINQNILK